MLFEYFLLTIAFIWLIIALVEDIRKREVPDWISYSLIFIGLGLIGLYSLIFKDYSYILKSLIALVIFLMVGNLMYYTKIWGGGDTKLLIGISVIFVEYPKILLNYFNPDLPTYFILVLWTNILIFGAIYGLVLSILFTFKNFIRFKEELKIVNSKVLKMKLISLVAGLILFLAYFLINDLPTKTMIFITMITVLLIPYLMIFVKAVENSAMIKKIKVKDLTEGDWVIEDITIKNKLVYSKKSPGIDKNQIQKLKESDIKEVMVKEGIPFVPAFVIAIIISLIYGNIIPL